jgi:hypothetical protein
MLIQTYPQITEREALVEALAQFRQGWEAAVDSERLIDVQGNVGLILVDITEILGLTQDEQMTVLGVELHIDVQEMLTQQVHLIE